jgi:RNA polymerase sigma-70 factor (ECF subfamily)
MVADEERKAIQQIQAGQVAALQTLIELVQVQAVQAAALITQDQAAAEDVVRNAFMRFFERPAVFDSRRPFRPWFMRVVINDALKAAAQQKRTPSLDAEQTYETLVHKLTANTDEPEDIVLRNELREAVRRAMQQLPPQQRAVIVQRYFLGLSEKEMSAALQVAPGTVKWHLNQARERLRLLLVTFAK